MIRRKKMGRGREKRTTKTLLVVGLFMPEKKNDHITKSPRDENPISVVRRRKGGEKKKGTSATVYRFQKEIYARRERVS